MPHTLLLADDSVTIQRVIELTFADEDVQVIAVGDGEQAIAVLNTRPPDIVLADIGMPKVDGYEVAQHIRITPALAHIPVVLLTGAFEPVDEARAAAVGVAAVLAKPFEPQLVITKVKELLARPRPEQAVVEAPLAPFEPSAGTPAELEAVGSVEAVEPLDVVEVTHALTIVEVIESTTSFSRGEGGEPVDPAAAAPPAAATVDEYFDRLDQAFASLAEGTTRAGEAVDAVDPVDDVPRAVAGTGSHGVAGETVVEPARALVEHPSSAPGPIGGQGPFPTLSEAFAALLDAEEVGPAAAARPVWPAAPNGAAGVAPEELVERVTHDVLQRLSDRVVRETVADIVSTVAERMVRDEIDRIKANIRA